MRFLLLFIMTFFLYAQNLNNKTITYLFKNRYYTYLCLNRWKYINKYEGKREDLLSIVAYACLKKHYLTYALDLAKNLRYTKNGRINSTYIISLFTIKNFLIRYIEDGFNLENINIPDIEGDDLGKIFVLTKKNHPKADNHSYKLDFNNTVVKIDYNVKTNDLILSFYKNARLFKKEKYW